MRRMATVEQLQAQVDALNRAIASGARSVTLGGQTVVYNTTDSLIRARDDRLAELNGLKAGKRRSRFTYLYQNGRGYD